MIPSTRELAYALYGGWRLLRFDRSGVSYFEESTEAFWRSFFAAVIVAPAHVILVALDVAALDITAGPLEVFLLEALAYVVGWLAFPLALYYLTAAIGKEERFVIAVVALNWSEVWRMAIVLPAIVLVETGLLPDGLSGLIKFAANIFVLGYIGFVAWAALEAAVLAAVGVVFLYLVLSMIILGFTQSLIT
jgi:hypothetical protein